MIARYLHVSHPRMGSRARSMEGPALGIPAAYAISDGRITKKPSAAITCPANRTQYFGYKPLDQARSQIRLLKISDPGNDPYLELREFRCQLVHKSLNEPFEYAALSYAWGEASDRPLSVLINWKPFNVSRNLYAALMMLRRQGPGLYWIDAICINQDDPIERSAQMQLMGRIYGMAKTVHVWLGEAHDDAPCVVPFLRDFMAAYQKQRDSGDQTRFPDLTSRKRRHYGYPEPSSPGYQALDRFLTSPWCLRLWIRQEVALAAAYIFHRGAYSVDPGAILVLAASHIYPDFYHEDLVVNRCLSDLMLVSLEHTRVQARKGCKLLALLLRHRAAIATEPRDKVYGLLSIASDVVDGTTVIPVDVNKTFQTVYTETAAAIIISAKSLDIFCAVDNACLPPRDGLPSWVPDWRPRGDRGRSDTRVSRVAEPGFKHIEDFRGDATRSSVPQPRFNGRRLGIRVMVVDSISTLGALMTRDIPLPPYPDWEMLAEARSGKRHPLTGDKMLCVYYETMTMGTCPGTDHERRAMYKKYDDTWRPMRKLLDRHIASKGVGVMMQEDGARDKLLMACRKEPLFQYMTSALNRCMAVTKLNGLLILAPAIAIANDLVVLCEGAKMPMVIREHNGAYQLVGDCYVAGAMHGELWTRDRMSLLEEITLE